MGQQGNVLPLPAMSAGQPGMPGPGYGAQQGFDTTGQVAPPGMKPRVTATLWEDEGSLCFQVEAKGVCVARREGTSQCFNFLEKRIDWKQQTITWLMAQNFWMLQVWLEAGEMASLRVKKWDM
jgi:hypothetical protein